MDKQIIITALFALIAMVGQAQRLQVGDGT